MLARARLRLEEFHELAVRLRKVKPGRWIHDSPAGRVCAARCGGSMVNADHGCS